MSGTVADDSLGENTINLDGGISNTTLQRSDKVSAQPSENNLQKLNGIVVASEDGHQNVRIKLIVGNAAAQSVTSDNDEMLLKETTELQYVEKTNSSYNYISEDLLQPLDLSSKSSTCNTNGFNGTNYVLIACDNTNTLKSSDDDDVIFVTTYTSATTATTTVAVANSDAQCSTSSSSVSSPSPPKVVRRRKKKKIAVVPRRNPKRVAQMEKASMDLAMKLSMPSRIFGCRTKSAAEVTKNCRQSCRTTGAILSPPRALRRKDWKEWPSEGLHEKPFYNPDTKCMHHFDKDSLFTSKLEEETTNESTSKKIVQRKREVDDDLATLTHQTLHSVLGYVADVKRYNRIREKAKKHYLGDFWSLFSTIADNNVRDACEILLNSCKLYCLCHGINEKDMVSYINSISVSDLEKADFDE